MTGDYVFDSPCGPVRFAELYANGKDTLYLYNFMFIPGEQGLPLDRSIVVVGDLDKVERPLGGGRHGEDSSGEARAGQLGAAGRTGQPLITANGRSRATLRLIPAPSMISTTSATSL